MTRKQHDLKAGTHPRLPGVAILYDETLGAPGYQVGDIIQYDDGYWSYWFYGDRSFSPPYKHMRSAVAAARREFERRR